MHFHTNPVSLKTALLVFALNTNICCGVSGLDSPIVEIRQPRPQGASPRLWRCARPTSKARKKRPGDEVGNTVLRFTLFC